jgi:hemerythrin-like metal-binding protein
MDTSMDFDRIGETGRSDHPADNTLTWRPEYACGQPTVDIQHRYLIDLANLACHASSSGMGDRVAGAILKGLARYTEEHFAFEERLLAQMDPDLAVSHRVLHRALTSDLELLIVEGFENWDDDFLDRLNQWIRTRLVAHMTGPDQAAFGTRKGS